MGSHGNYGNGHTRSSSSSPSPITPISSSSSYSRNTPSPGLSDYRTSLSARESPSSGIGTRPPLINKLKQKVASHGSRVMASFRPESSSSSSSSSHQTVPQHDFDVSQPPHFHKLRSQSSLTNEQLTAHLTEEEKLILQKVFLKEEEFHRESAMKR